VKFSPDKTDIIVNVSSSNKLVKISIKDYGVGIPKEHQSEIFKRFYQVSNTSMNGRVGLGLGLYISGEIVKKHGGKLWVKSKPGHGSTFFFTLPRTKKS
jgi:signal transduction histidine kinase